MSRKRSRSIMPPKLSDNLKSILPPADEVAERDVFSRVCMSISLSTVESHVTISHDALDLTIQVPPQPRSTTYPSLQGPRHGHVQTCSSYTSFYRDTPPPTLWKVYGWQAGSWHPSGMLSCLKCSQCGHIKLFEAIDCNLLPPSYAGR